MRNGEACLQRETIRQTKSWQRSKIQMAPPKNLWQFLPELAMGEPYPTNGFGRSDPPVPCHRLPKRTFAADSVRPCGPCQDGPTHPTGSPNIWCCENSLVGPKWPKGSKPRESPGLSHQNRDLWM